MSDDPFIIQLAEKCIDLYDTYGMKNRFIIIRYLAHVSAIFLALAALVTALAAVCAVVYYIWVFWGWVLYAKIGFLPGAQDGTFGPILHGVLSLVSYVSIGIGTMAFNETEKEYMTPKERMLKNLTS